MNNTRSFSSILILSLLFGIAGIAVPQSKAIKAESKDTVQTKNPLVTFVELGSVKCIPCRQMQPVMRAIEKKYGDQVKVVFHDVWKSDQYEYAEKYEIKLIPTQVFLDKKGKEFFRHEGFYPEAEIDKLLQKRGLKIRSEG
jgi:thiol-disulfide isomerase/thioredoxin